MPPFPPPPPAPDPTDHEQAASDHVQASSDHLAAHGTTTVNTTNYAARAFGAREAIAVATIFLIGVGAGLWARGGSSSSGPNSTAAAARDPYVQPFTSTSIWNQPIGSNASYVASGIQAPTLRAMAPDVGVVIQDPTAPATTIAQNGGQHSNTCSGTGALASDPVPAALLVPGSNHNAEFAVVKADGRAIDEGGAFARCTIGGPATAGHLKTYGTVFGDGLTGGSGGSGLSTLGGTLKPGEIAPGKPGPTHALRVNLDGPHDLWPGTTATCFRWPATKCDGYGPSGGANTKYGGTNPKLTMGALLAVPTSTPCLSLGLSAAGAELCFTLQNYGAYVSNDAARSVFSISTESGDGDTAATFQSQWGFPLATTSATGTGWANDVQTIIKHLSVVDNNGPGSIGGGGTPLQPLAPPLGTSCLTAAPVAIASQTGTVVSVDPGPPVTLTVSLASGTVSGVRYLTSYAPAVGDSVVVEQVGADFVVLGIESGAPPSPTATPTPTPTATASPTPTVPPTPSPSATGSPSPSPSPCPSPSPSGTATPTPTATPTGTSTPTPSPTATVTPTPTLGGPHVLVVMEENKGYAATLGTCSADPYFCGLAAGYASYTNSHGITHPSQPNYFAFISGSTQGCTSDTCGAFSAATLGSQLTVPWTAWMESMPSACDKSNAGGYVLKHDPFASSSAITACAAHVLPYPGATGAVAALDGATPPSFAWITPNLTNDMHDGSVAQGDTWLKANLGPILASSWFTNFHSTVIVTMDESDAGSTNQIPTVIISNVSKGQGAIATAVTHYSVLRAIEETYGLALLGGAASATDVHGSFG